MRAFCGTATRGNWRRKFLYTGNGPAAIYNLGRAFPRKEVDRARMADAVFDNRIDRNLVGAGAERVSACHGRSVGTRERLGDPRSAAAGRQGLGPDPPPGGPAPLVRSRVPRGIRSAHSGEFGRPRRAEATRTGQDQGGPEQARQEGAHRQLQRRGMGGTKGVPASHGSRGGYLLGPHDQKGTGVHQELVPAAHGGAARLAHRGDRQPTRLARHGAPGLGRGDGARTKMTTPVPGGYGRPLFVDIETVPEYAYKHNGTRKGG